MVYGGFNHVRTNI
uniref:Uncharacterized protein n=1 Tax=Arundo donax TaxID=35708 RepID=A0A0A8Y407_ARUDO